MVAGGFGVLIGAFTLFFAARAAHWARKAAEHTEAGANVSRVGTEANVMVDRLRTDGLKHWFDSEAFDPTSTGLNRLYFYVSNSGPTAAYDIAVTATMTVFMREADPILCMAPEPHKSVEMSPHPATECWFEQFMTPDCAAAIRAAYKAEEIARISVTIKLAYRTTFGTAFTKQYAFKTPAIVERENHPRIGTVLEEAGVSIWRNGKPLAGHCVT
jgi:hypothetical protein